MPVSVSCTVRDRETGVEVDGRCETRSVWADEVDDRFWFRRGWRYGNVDEERDVVSPTEKATSPERT